MFEERPEEWRDIEGFPTYLISDHGRVMNWRTGRILRLTNHGSGTSIAIREEKRVYTKQVSHLVYAAFGDESYVEGSRVGYRNGDTTNNHIDNLYIIY